MLDEPRNTKEVNLDRNGSCTEMYRICNSSVNLESSSIQFTRIGNYKFPISHDSRHFTTRVYGKPLIIQYRNIITRLRIFMQKQTFVNVTEEMQHKQKFHPLNIITSTLICIFYIFSILPPLRIRIF